MAFVDRHGSIMGRSPCACLHPRVIAPLIVKVPHSRGRFRRGFRVVAKRIGLVETLVTISGRDAVLVGDTRAKTWNKPLPQTALTDRVEKVLVFVPIIELAENRDCRGVGGPGGEVDAIHTVGSSLGTPEPLIEARMSALIEEVEVFGCQQGEG